MKVRVALPSDAQEIAALHAASWRYAYRGALSEEYLAGDILAERSAVWTDRFQCAPPNQYVVVAEIESQIIGFACAYANEDAQWGTLLDNIHVSQSVQRQGVGLKLMAAVGQWCELTAPASGLFLWVLQSNLPAQRFYEGLGAVNVGADVWFSPDGGSVPTYQYTWQNIQVLLQNCASQEKLKRQTGS